MGRRSSFPRRPHDSYSTPEKAVLPLLPMLAGVKQFAEPCRGEGKLVKLVEAHGPVCAYQGDILTGQDALDRDFGGLLVITNPPWSRPELHKLIWHFANLGQAWLLIDFNWCGTLQAASMLSFCELILPVGRVSWMGNGVDSMEAVAWYKFDGRHSGGPVLLPRVM